MNFRPVLRCLVMAGLWPLCPAAAEPLIPRAELPGLGEHDARQTVDASAAPWRSLGRVQTELGQRCTGTLIAPDRVLTAAHCLTARRRDQLVRPGSVHFLLGYAAGRFQAHRRVVSFQVGPGFSPAQSGPAGADWAILRLQAPLDAPTLPLRPPAAGDQIVLGGYQQDRPEVIMADNHCQLLQLGRLAGLTVVAHGCAGTRGASGAPLLRDNGNGDWSVAGIAVAASRHQAGGIGVPAQAIRPSDTNRPP